MCFSGAIPLGTSPEASSGLTASFAIQCNLWEILIIKKKKKASHAVSCIVTIYIMPFFTDTPPNVLMQIKDI